MKRSMLGFAVVVGACSSNPPPIVNVPPPDLNIPPIGTTATVATPAKLEECHVRLSAAPIHKSSPGCYLTEGISKGDGLLTYPCNGDGVAEAVFENETYSGRMSSFELDLESKNEIEWEGDHCRWGSTANIRGGPIGSVTAKLVWSYHDYVLRGDRCSGTCTAASELTANSAGP